jgi:hypothetical protein
MRHGKASPIVAVALSLATPLVLWPTNVIAGEICVPTPPESPDITVSYVDDVQADRTKVWSASATYELSTGDIGEAYITVDSNNTGEAYFAINGEIVSHTTISQTEQRRGPTFVSWAPDELDYPPEVLVELMQAAAGEMMINGMIPQEFKCSDFGKKAVRVAKYLWIAASAAVGAACTMATGAAIPCAAGATALGAIGADVAEDHCD